MCLELGTDIDEARRVAAEIGASSATSLVVGFYRPEEFAGSESLATSLVELMRTNVSDFVRRPVSSTELESLLRRHLEIGPRKASERGRIVSFVGNKGGVGKTTMALNVACRLALRRPDRVLLVDAALQHGADCDLLGLSPEATLRDAALQIERLDGRLLRTLSTPHQSGLRVLAAPANAIEAAAVTEQAMARILNVARHSFDFVVVDTFPLIDSTTVAILDLSDRVYVTLNAFVPSVLGAAELFGVLEQLGVPSERIRVVLNHSHPRFRGSLRGSGRSPTGWAATSTSSCRTAARCSPRRTREPPTRSARRAGGASAAPCARSSASSSPRRTGRSPRRPPPAGDGASNGHVPDVGEDLARAEAGGSE